MQRRKFLKSGATGIIFSSTIVGCTSMSSEKKHTPEGFIREEHKNIPVQGNYDVVVCGAGPAGVCAAIAAAREGAKTLLVESQGCLGGTWTAGLLTWILDQNNKNGILLEIIEKLKNAGATAAYYKGNNFPFDVEQMKLVLEELCLDAGVDILFHSWVAEVIKTKNKHLTHIITESKSGREAWNGKIFIDATGDGDVAAKAGCEFKMGEEGSGLTQPFSLLSIISGIDYQEAKPFIRRAEEPGGKTKRRLLEEIRKAGIEPSMKQPGIFPMHNDLYMIMWNHEYGYKGINTKDITKATLHARSEVNKIVNGLRSLGGIWKNLTLIATPEHIGIREGRRIKGLYTVSKEDMINGTKHGDAVCTVTFGVDVHALAENDNKNYKIKSKNYDIPLRALISKDVDNLMMAGRNISGDFIAHSSYRVTGNAAAMGEGAGKHAAMAAKNKKMPGEMVK